MKTVFKYCLLLLLLAFTYCKKEPVTSITGISSTNIKYGGILIISGKNFDTSAGAYKIYITDNIKGYILTPLSVSHDQIKVEIFNQEDSTALLQFSSFYAGLEIGTKIIMFDQKINLITSWKKVLDFPGGARYKTSAFSLGGNIYTGAGAGPGIVYKDFWKYNPTSDTWTKLDDYPGPSRVYPRSFSNSTNGFIGAGYSTDNSSRIQYYDFYKYNPANNTWAIIPNYPDNILSYYIGYTINVNGRPFISLSNQVLSARE